MEEALSQARQHYEGVLGKVRGGGGGFEGVGGGERERLERELWQLEDRVASLMQGRCMLNACYDLPLVSTEHMSSLDPRLSLQGG